MIFCAGDSEAGRDIAARSADVVFTAKQDLDDARAFYASVKGRLPKYGRSDDEVIIMPGLMPIVGPTRSEAQAKHDALQALLDPVVGLASLYDRLGDLSGYPLDGPVPEPRDPAFKSRADEYTYTLHAGSSTTPLDALGACACPGPKAQGRPRSAARFTASAIAS